MSIQVQSLSFSYNKQQVLRDISFSIGSGKIVALLGPNGAGKSTLMRLLTSYLPIQKGKIVVCGLQVDKKGKELRRRIGYLPENNPLYEDMYVEEILRFFGRLWRMRRKKLQLLIQDMVAHCGLSEVRHKKVYQLSKGYRQRLGLARVLLHEPQVLILDEPTSGLDPNQLMDIRQLIRELRNHMCILFSTHVLQEVEALCDEVLLLHEGQILAQQPLSDFRRKYAREDLLEVEFVDPPVDLGALLTLDELEQLQQLSSCRYLLRAKTGRDLRQPLLLACQKKRLKIRQISKATQSLEGIFQQLTRNQGS